MADVMAETKVDGPKGDTTPEKLKEAKNDDVKEKTEDVIESEENGEPAVKKAKASKENSVIETKAANEEETTRSGGRGARNSKGSSKRLNTLSRIAKEGVDLLREMGHKDDNPDSGRRRTRSQTKGTPPPTARQESAKRGSTKRGRPKKGEKQEKDEPEKEAEKMESAEVEDKDELNNNDKVEEEEEEEAAPAEKEESTEATENSTGDEADEQKSQPSSEDKSEETAA